MQITKPVIINGSKIIIEVEGIARTSIEQLAVFRIN
ncbi:MAG: hypothetical protein HeimC3_34410 [Candidatus Heimdallarchaeota archaeon LC_3]|nr:MAG: hypothetical protein HeimC3_34410 [Candidatus Heimdallarchaeota archaeon LC_3]